VKKAASIALILIYTITFMGAGMTVKYCCGKLYAIEWFTATRSGAQDDGTATLRSLGCCAECSLQFQAAPAVSPVFAPVPDPAPSIPEAALFSQEIKLHLPAVSDHHPRLEDIHGQPPPLFLMNRMFRI